MKITRRITALALALLMIAALAACGSSFRKSVMFPGSWPKFPGIIFQKTVYTFISGRS